MDSFNEFRDSLNKRPENTRSSLIDSQPSNVQPNFHARFIDPEYNDSEDVTTHDRNTDVPSTTFNRTDSQNISQKPSDRLFQQTNSNGVYNSSGKPFNMSEFKKYMDSDPLSDNDISSIRNSTARFFQKDMSSSFPDVPRNEHGRSQYEISIPNIPHSNILQRNVNKDLFKTYNESGRSFNLEKRQLNHSQTSGHNQNFNRSRVEQRRTGAVDSRTPHHSNQCEHLRDPSGCDCDSRQTSKFQCKPNGETYSTSTVRPVPQIKINPLHETLVKDSYYPGVIVEAVNGLIDFNQIAFNAVFDCQEVPHELEHEAVPMSLLEAFEQRIQYEKDLQNDYESRYSFCLSEMKKKNQRTTKIDTTPEENIDELRKEAAEDVQYRAHRDELKLASTVDIDLMSKVRHYPETPLTEAIKCLFKAEKMNGFDKSVHMAEEAIRLSSEGHHELAALQSTCSLKLSLHKDETKTPKTSTYEPLAIISYIGTTKPDN